MLLRFQNRHFTPVFEVRPSFRAKRLHLILQNCNLTLVFQHVYMYVVKSQFYNSFARSTFIWCEKVASKVSNLHQLFTFVYHFRKGDAAAQWRIKFAFHRTFAHRTHTRSPQKVAWTEPIHTLPHIWVSDTHDLHRGLLDWFFCFWFGSRPVLE